MNLNTKAVNAILIIVSLGVVSFFLMPDDPEVTPADVLGSGPKGVSLPAECPDRLQSTEFEKKLAQAHALYRQRIAAHQRTIDTLNERIEKLKYIEEMASPAPSSRDAITNTEPSSPMVEVDAIQEEDQELLALELEQHLAGEVYDAEWAEPIEAQITDAITEELQLEGNELVEATCGSTICRIEFGHESERAESRFLMAIASRDNLINSFDDIFVYRVASDDSLFRTARSVFFVARKGHELPVSTYSGGGNE